MALTREQSLSKYGTEAYTAWDEPGAQADWGAKNPSLNVLQKQPNPAQLTSGNQTVQANKPSFTPIKGFTNLQNQYAKEASETPDYMAMYQDLAQKQGLTDVNKLITDIDNTVSDIEDKIAKVEPNINKEVGNYLITEGQRGRMVTAGEEPLRTQYADILRSRSKLSAEATAKANLVNTLMDYAKESRVGRIEYLKSLIDIEASNKTKAAGDLSTYLGGKEPKPTTAPKGEDQKADALLKGVTIDDSGNINQPTKTSTQKFDKYGNLILGGGIKIETKPKTKPMSTSTMPNRLLNLSA